jgi:hypothetical protein
MTSAGARRCLVCRVTWLALVWKTATTSDVAPHFAMSLVMT